MPCSPCHRVSQESLLVTNFHGPGNLKLAGRETCNVYKFIWQASDAQAEGKSLSWLLLLLSFTAKFTDKTKRNQPHKLSSEVLDRQSILQREGPDDICLTKRCKVPKGGHGPMSVLGKLVEASHTLCERKQHVCSHYLALAFLVSSALRPCFLFSQWKGHSSTFYIWIELNWKWAQAERVDWSWLLVLLIISYY